MMVLCKCVSETRMDEDMRLYLRTNTYLTKDDQWFKERLHRTMPCTPLAALQGEICCRCDSGGIPLGAEAQETNTGETSHQCSYRSPDDSSIHGCEPDSSTCIQNPGPSFRSWNKRSRTMMSLTAIDDFLMFDEIIRDTMPLIFFYISMWYWWCLHCKGSGARWDDFYANWYLNFVFTHSSIVLRILQLQVDNCLVYYHKCLTTYYTNFGIVQWCYTVQYMSASQESFLRHRA